VKLQPCTDVGATSAFQPCTRVGATSLFVCCTKKSATSESRPCTDVGATHLAPTRVQQWTTLTGQPIPVMHYVQDGRNPYRTQSPLALTYRTTNATTDRARGSCVACGHPEYFHELNACDFDTDTGRCTCTGFEAAQ
jgi:hypothetical protein